MKLVVVNIPFVDRYTGKMHKADGKPVKMTAERVAEIKEVNPNLITVIGNVEEPTQPDVNSGENSGEDSGKDSGKDSKGKKADNK